MNIKEKLQNSTWGVKHRPNSLSEMILPSNLMKCAQGWISAGNIPSMIFSGRPGSGKTTLARVLAKELGLSYYEINASLHRNIDTIREKVLGYAGSASLNGKKKILCLDEADALNSFAQDSLRNLIETYDKNCTILFTCNNVDSIIDAIKSRSTVIEFNIPKDEQGLILDSFYKRIVSILDFEEVAYKQEVLENIIISNFPDFRKILNIIGSQAKSGLLEDISSISTVNTVDELFGFLKAKSFVKTQKWVTQNLNDNPIGIFRSVYDNIKQFLTKESIPVLVLIIAKYMDMSTRAKDQEINTVAFLVEVMEQCEFK
jgi:DNA polymerase III delta prime subunit